MPLTRRKFCSTTLWASAVCLLATPGVQAQNTRVYTVAGRGQTTVDNPYGVVADAQGNLVFCEVDTGRTRSLSLADGRITTIAGNGEKAYAGDGRPALSAAFSAPHEICFDRDGHLFVVERDAHVVRRIDAISGLVSTFAGTGEPGFSGDGGPSDMAQLQQPHSIAFDDDGNLLICDIGNQRVRRVQRGTRVINTLSGTGERDATPDSGPLSGTSLRGPRSIATDPDGNAYLVLREGNAVYQLALKDGTLSRIAGTGESGYSGDGGQALQANFNGPKGIAYSAVDHSLYIVDTENHVIRRVALASGLISTVLGTGQVGDGADGDPLQCALARPHGVCILADVLYVTDSENHRIRAIEGLFA
tara:strand:- start:3329 stop:4411 length:1083 start_codon:yes stop_codon:yes gene_type:complete